jgi:UDP-2-acetamido-2-deoxy-ribo-hexuluronate aminotransferase
MTNTLQMVDLKGQYQRIKTEIDAGIQQVIDDATFINGPSVKAFQAELEAYLGVRHVIPCANGTDALQIALMGLGLQAGDEVIVPAFTYVATAEVIGLLGLQPVMIDVDPQTFNITPELVEAAITPRTKAIVPVHLFGQCADMGPLMELASKHGLYVIEDNAQAIGADYFDPSGQSRKAGTIGHVGTTSFFPSKNLGCYGDGGALMTNDDALAQKLRMIANHGQAQQYYHEVIGVNSRLDALQAVVLSTKLKYLDTYAAARQAVAATYDATFGQIDALMVPVRQHNSTHVFHQYTLQLRDAEPDTRVALRTHLAAQGVPMMVYYPVPLYKQKAFEHWWPGGELPVTERLCDSVFSLPMHTEHTEATLGHIIGAVTSFFGR